MASPVIQVFLITPGMIPMDQARAVLSSDEMARADGFIFKKHADPWISYRAAMRMILGGLLDQSPESIAIITGAMGKPMLEKPENNFYFNLSHCDHLAIFAVSTDREIGVDLEPGIRGRELLECVDFFCHPEEIATLSSQKNLRCQQLLEIWTAKEAVLKAMGVGLFQAPESLKIRFSETHANAHCDALLPGLSSQCIRRIEHPDLADYTAMISSANVAKLEIQHFTP